MLKRRKARKATDEEGRVVARSTAEDGAVPRGVVAAGGAATAGVETGGVETGGVETGGGMESAIVSAVP